MLVTVVCDLLVASEQLLCTIRECTSQAAVTGLVCQQCLILLVCLLYTSDAADE